ncbi:hypothetical protein CVT26_000559 [Gymnopilus dilepis]|uniref:Uncharacterized protein n=1 Tax=Gymnopilus dilepis TaxID=231916 RepID=A0A409VH86_9AGAR|nr:hypothetical protein CVT26_000559 [Gymnopilus dilepis]
MGLSTLETVLLQLRPDSLNLVLAELDILSLLRFSRSSTCLRSIYFCYKETAWDPVKSYQRWFNHPAAFRRLLRRTNAVISGSFALQFFDRSYYPDSDMDIYLRCAGAMDVCRWLTTEGYRYVKSDKSYKHVPLQHQGHIQKAVKNNSTLNRPLLGVYNFKKTLASSTGYIEQLLIQVIVVDIDPIEHILFGFHSTAVINFLTADDAISVFPRSTFIHRLSYISSTQLGNSNRFPTWRSKYERRGFTFMDGFSRPNNHFLVTGPRFVMDRFCWHIHFRNEPFRDLKRPYYGDHNLKLHFEILTRSSGVVAEGAYIRVAEPLIWR